MISNEKYFSTLPSDIRKYIIYPFLLPTKLYDKVIVQLKVKHGINLKCKKCFHDKDIHWFTGYKRYVVFKTCSECRKRARLAILKKHLKNDIETMMEKHDKVIMKENYEVQITYNIIIK
jgi:hypothetical protein